MNESQEKVFQNATEGWWWNPDNKGLRSELDGQEVIVEKVDWLFLAISEDGIMKEWILILFQFCSVTITL